MPTDYKIFPQKRLIVVSYTGVLTLEEVLVIRKKSSADPDFDSSFNVIDDISGVVSTAINFNEVSQIAGQSVSQQGVKRALVAVTDLQRGMAHMYQKMSESAGHIFRIFESYDLALAWVLDSGRPE